MNQKKETFDLVVIGSGAAGGTAAALCARGGQKVAVVDSYAFGGTCALRGCMPKKTLVGVAGAVDRFNLLAGKGAAGGPGAIDWPALMAFKRSFTEPTPSATEKSYADMGITNFHGRGTFIDGRQLELGDKVLEADRFVIAAGAKPMDLGIPGSELVTISDEFLELPALPARVIFIGGGFISFEFAHLSRRAGAEVTVLDRGGRPLKPFDPDLVEQLVSASEEMGIEIKRNRVVDSVSREGDHLAVRVKNAKGAEEKYEADMVVHGAGRVPDMDDLGLEAAGVERSRKGVVVNEYLQSVSNSAFYACGDAAEVGPPLTPVGLYQGALAAENILHGNRRQADHRVVPSVAFTGPPLGTVGLHEARAREKGIDVRVNHGDTTNWFTSRHLGARASAFKVVIDNSSDEILGAHILGPEAEELTNLFALAIRERMTASRLKGAIFAYPTASSDLVYML